MLFNTTYISIMHFLSVLGEAKKYLSVTRFYGSFYKRFTNDLPMSPTDNKILILNNWEYSKCSFPYILFKIKLVLNHKCGLINFRF